MFMWKKLLYDVLKVVALKVRTWATHVQWNRKIHDEGGGQKDPENTGKQRSNTVN